MSIDNILIIDYNYTQENLAVPIVNAPTYSKFCRFHLIKKL